MFDVTNQLALLHNAAVQRELASGTQGGIAGSAAPSADTWSGKSDSVLLGGGDPRHGAGVNSCLAFLLVLQCPGCHACVPWATQIHGFSNDCSCCHVQGEMI